MRTVKQNFENTERSHYSHLEKKKVAKISAEEMAYPNPSLWGSGSSYMYGGKVQQAADCRKNFLADGYVDF